MSWIAQVRHVFAKDVGEVRWLVLAYVVLVVLATAAARDAAWMPEFVRGLGDFSSFVWVGAVFLIAVVVQSDSPTRTDAFWASHPMRPSAVMGAKILWAIVLLTIATIGQYVAVRAFDPGSNELWWPVLAGIPGLGIFLLAAMLGSALVRDLRGFVLLIVGWMASQFFIGSLVWAIRGGIEAEADAAGRASGFAIPFDLLATAFGLAMLVWIYRRRDARLGLRITGLLVAAFALMTAGVRATFATSEGPPAVDRDRVPLTLVLETNRIQVHGFELTLYGRGWTESLHEQLLVRNATAELRLRDGRVLTLTEKDNRHALVGRDAALVRAPDLEWLGVRAPRQMFFQFNATLTPDERRAMEAGVAAIVLEAEVVVVRARELLTMPLVPGTQRDHGGLRILIEGWSTAFGEPVVNASMKSLVTPTPARSDVWAFSERFQAALINRERGEALELNSGQASGGGGTLVLPGVHFARRAVEFSRRRPMGAPSTDSSLVDEAWLRNAELMITEQVQSGAFPIRLEATVGDSSRR